MYIWIDVEPSEFDRSEFSKHAVVREVEVGPDTHMQRVYEPISSATFVEGVATVVFPDNAEIDSPSWLVWGIVQEVPGDHPDCGKTYGLDHTFDNGLCCWCGVTR